MKPNRDLEGFRVPVPVEGNGTRNWNLEPELDPEPLVAERINQVDAGPVDALGTVRPLIALRNGADEA